MTQEIFDNIVNMFKKRYIFLENVKQCSPLQQVLYQELKEDAKNLDLKDIEYYQPYHLKIDWNYLINLDKEIVLYFDSINPDWSKKYHEQDYSIRTISTIDIFVYFQSYVKNLMNEEYIECKNIKEKIFVSY